MVYRASAGIPRVINLVCDRSLSRGHLEQVTVISPEIVAKAMEDLRLGRPSTITEHRAIRTSPEPRVTTTSSGIGMPPRNTAVRTAPTRSIDATHPPPRADVRPAAASQTTLSADPFAFVETQAPRQTRPKATPRSDVPAVEASDLKALLDLAPTLRHEADPEPEQASLGFTPMPAWKTRVAAQRTRRKSRFSFLRTLMLPLLGMGVMLLAGGLALKAHDRISAQPAALAVTPLPTLRVPGFVPVGAIVSSAPIAPIAPPPVEPFAARALIAPVASGDVWIVQVAAFTGPDRSAALVERLTEAGMPAYQVVTDAGAQGALYIVRVGPYRVEAQAENVRARVRQMPDLADAFVRNVTTAPAATHH
jgi:hypothetical protein